METDDVVEVLSQISDKLDRILERLDEISSTTGKIMLDLGQPPS